VAQLEYDGTDFILINAKDVATYSAEQTETVEVASLPNTAVEGEVDAVVKGATIVNLTGTFRWMRRAQVDGLQIIQV
jgi:hypothetical protein